MAEVNGIVTAYFEREYGGELVEREFTVLYTATLDDDGQVVHVHMEEVEENDFASGRDRLCSEAEFSADEWQSLGTKAAEHAKEKWDGQRRRQAGA